MSTIFSLNFSLLFAPILSIGESFWTNLLLIGHQNNKYLDKLAVFCQQGDLWWQDTNLTDTVPW